MSSKIAKPKLHGLAVARTSKWLISALINAAIGGFLFRQFYIKPKMWKYKNFYENYDIDKEFECMREKGLFDSC